MMKEKRWLWLAGLLSICITLSACSSSSNQSVKSRKTPLKTVKTSQQMSPIDQNAMISRLEQHRRSWAGTRYVLGGTTKKGVDCSGFTQVTYRELFGKSLPRMTVDQAKVGKKIARNQLKTGDLVFFNTGRGPNGKHVGIYVKNGEFLHASSKKGVIYSNLNNPYWNKAFWQARRL